MSGNNYTLIDNVPYTKLLAGMRWLEVGEVWEKLGPHLKEHTPTDIGIAYLLGIKQGIHNERKRQRVNQTHREETTA